MLIDNFKLGTLDKWGFSDAWFEAACAAGHALLDHRLWRAAARKPRSPVTISSCRPSPGLMSICGEQDGGPTKYGVAIVDVCTGLLACNSILAALNARHRTGKGQKVDVSLYETSLAMLVNVASNCLISARTAAVSATAIPASCPTPPIAPPTA